MKKKPPKTTLFHRKIISVIKKIPKGYVATYGQVAKLAGYPGYARQVVWTLHSSSGKYRLPWHRVINSKGEIGLQDAFFLRQKNLLQSEGVESEELKKEVDSVESKVEYAKGEEPECCLCSNTLKSMGLTENSEYVAVTEKTYYITLQKREKYRCDKCLGKARDYFLKNSKELSLFLEDGIIPIDNNLAERGLRGPVVGRKNYFGNHSKRGAKTSSILLSIIESCKLNQVNSARYLKETVQMIHQGLAPLTPAEFALQKGIA